MITSARSAKVRALRGLRSAQNRARLGLALVEGPHALASVLEAGAVVDTLATSYPLSARRHRDLIGRAMDAGARRLEVSEQVMGVLCGTANPPALVASVRIPQATDQDGALEVLLVDIQDPASLGAILQSSVAFGVSTVTVADGSSDPWGAKAIRASSGAGWWMRVGRGSPGAVIASARSSARQVVVFAEDGGDIPASRPSRALLVIGPGADRLDADMRCAPPRAPFQLGPSVVAITALSRWAR